MINHEFGQNLTVDSVQGQAYLVNKNNQIVEPLRQGMTITPDDVILTNNNSFVIVSDGVQLFSIDSQCASCLIPISSDKDKSEDLLASAPIAVSFNNDALLDSNSLPIDVEKLQQEILKGKDPTQLFEQTSAGNEQSSSNSGFVVLDYHYAQTLTKAGFDTQGFSSEPEAQSLFIQERNIDIEGAGGQKMTSLLNEHQLSENLNGINTSAHFTLFAGTQTLLANSLQIAPDALSVFLSELEKLTSAGSEVVFDTKTIIDAQGNSSLSLIGSVDDKVALSVILTGTQTGKNIFVTASLNQYLPLDHNDETGSYVNINDQRIEINVPLQAQDSSGELLLSPAVVSLITTDSAARGGKDLML